MNDTEEYVRQLFAAQLERQMSLADYLPEVISIAGSKIVNALLNDGKIFICGKGSSYANALEFTNALIDQYLRERPALPVILLSDGLSTQSLEQQQCFARQIQALGVEKDLLLILTTAGESTSLVHAMDAAKDKNIDIIILNGSHGGLISNHLGPEDFEIRVPLEHPAHIRETHLFILHCFCELIEQALFGVN